MNTFDKSLNADKSIKLVAGGTVIINGKAIAVNPAPLTKNARDNVANKSAVLREKKKNQDEESEQFEEEAAAASHGLDLAWLHAQPEPGVLLAQTSVNDGARTVSDGATASGALGSIDWGVASNSQPASSGLSTLWSGAALLGGLLVAGLGGSSNKDGAKDTSMKITVQDGLIAGAKVYHNVKDEEHLVGVTDANGQLNLTKTLKGSGVLIAVGGKNIDTQLDNTVELKLRFTDGIIASSVITPVTTLVAALVDNGYEPDVASAENTVSRILGLSGTLNLSTYDPMTAANVGTADALTLRIAGAQIVHLASQVPNAAQFIKVLASEITNADSWDQLILNENGFIDTVLAGQWPGMPVNERGAKADTLVDDFKGLQDASAQTLSQAQKNAAQLTLELSQDTGLKDQITTNAQLNIEGYNTGGSDYKSLEVSLDHGQTWSAYGKTWPFTTQAGVNEIAIMVRQAGVTGTESPELSFTWVSQEVRSPQLRLADDTGASGTDGITQNPHVTWDPVINPDIVVNGRTFEAELQYSLQGSKNFQTISDPAEGLFKVLQSALVEGKNELEVRAYYPELGLESDPARLSFTFEKEATIPRNYAIAAVEGEIQDIDNNDLEFSTEGASSVLFTMTQAPDEGATVTLTINGVDHAVTANEKGVWQATIRVDTLNEGLNTPRLHIVDAAGNEASADLDEFRVDNLAFVSVGQDLNSIATLAEESDSFNRDNITNVTLPEFVGVAEPGALISLSVDYEVIGTGIADETGHWRIESTVVLAEYDDYELVVTVTDQAGNISEHAGALFSIVTTKPRESEGGEIALSEDLDPSSDDLLMEKLKVLMDEAGLDHDFMAVRYDDLPEEMAEPIVFEFTSLDTGADNTDGITMFPFPILSGTVEGSGDLYVFITLHDTDPEAFTPKFTLEPALAVDGEWSVQVKQELGASDETHTYIAHITVMDGAGNIFRTTGAQAIVIDRQYSEEATARLVHDEENDTGSLIDDAITGNVQPMLEGEAEAGATIVVQVIGESASYAYTTTVEADGTWTVEVEDELTDGDYELQVIVIDLAGNVSDPITGDMFTIDAMGPTEATANLVHDEDNDTGMASDDGLTNNPNPMIEGTTEANATVTALVGDNTYETQADEDGAWSITAEGLGDGEYTPLITVTDAVGNVSEEFEGEMFTVDVTAPDEATANLVHDEENDTGVDAEDGFTRSTSVLIEGTTEALAYVSVDVGGTAYETQADEDGVWSVTAEGLEDGEYTPLITVTDAAGNVSEEIEGELFTVDATAPEEAAANLVHDEQNDTGVDTEDNLTGNNSPLIEGTTESLAWVSVVLGDNTYETQADEDGVWSVQADGLDDGEYTPEITVTDAAGNVSEVFYGEMFEVDATAPDVATLTGGLVHDSDNDTGVDAEDGMTNNTAPLIEGLADPLSHIKVDLNGAVFETDADETGYWSVNAEDLTDGEYTPVITVVDAAGNESEAFEGALFTVDATAITEATANLVHDEENDTGVDAEDGFTRSTSVLIEGTTEALAYVSVDVGGTAYETQADEDGVWSVTAEGLEDGEYTPLITVTDAAGNVSEEIEGELFTVDATAPEEAAANLVHDEENDTGVDTEDNLTGNNSPLIEGTTESLAWVSVVLGDNTYETQADEDGVWSVQADGLDDGEYTPEITVTDAAGNVSEVFYGEMFEVDATAPDVATLTGGLVHDSDNDTGVDAEDGMTNNTAPLIEGLADPLSHIKVDLNGAVFETDADETGYWSVNAEDLTDGEYTPVITVVDAAGNESEAFEGALFTVDATAITEATANLVHDEENDTGVDAEDGFTRSTSVLIEGTTEALAYVSVDVGGTAYETQADEDGVWSVTAEGLEDGEYTPLITVTDAAGNVSEEIEGELFTVDATAPEEAAANLVHDEENDTGVDTEDNLTGNNSPLIEGTTESLAWVSVVLGDNTYETQADEDGVWSVQADGLDVGEYTPEITVTDAAGNVSEVFYGEMFEVDATAPDVATLTGGLVHDSDNDTGVDAEDGMTNNTAPLIEGLADPLSHIKVDLNGAVFETDADETGYWSVNAEDLTDGEYTPVITVVDAAGNESEAFEGALFTVDATVPDGSSLTGGLVHDDVNDTGVDTNDSITQNSAPALEGMAEFGVIVSVDIDGNVVETVADENGSWEVTFDGLSDGEYTPVVTLTDIAGNTSDSVELGLLVIDTSAPTDITADLVHDELNDTGADQEDNITANQSPWIEGEGEPGAAVSVEIDQQTYTTTVTEDGLWRVQALNLAGGTYTAMVTMTDAAGNVSDPVETLPIEIDATAPELLSVYLVQDEDNDTGQSQTDKLTNNRTPAIEGYTSALVLVQMELEGLSYEVEADEEGYFNFTIDAELLDGVYAPTFVLQDLAGNVNTVSDGLSFTVDTVPPSVAEFLTPYYIVKNTPIDLQPLGADHVLNMGEMVEDYFGSLPEGLTIDESFHITGTVITPGATWLAVTQADLAGNLATSYQHLVAVSVVKAPSAAITSLNTDSLKASLYQGTLGDDAMTLYKSTGDVWLALDGDDTIKITSEEGLGFAAIDGGDGTDLLKLMVTGMDFDLASYNDPDASEKTIHNIEVIQMNGTDSNLSLSARDIFELDSDALDIDGLHHLLRVDSGTLGSGRTVTLSGMSQVGVAKGFNADGSDADANAGLYAKYEGIYTDPMGTEHLVALLVQQGLTAQLFY